MFTVVQVGSLQYKVSEGDMIEVQRLQEKDGKTVTLDKVLLAVDGSHIKVGQPYLKDVKVSATVAGQTLDDKAISYKYQRRKSRDWKKGHRQKLTCLKISKISGIK